MRPRRCRPSLPSPNVCHGLVRGGARLGRPGWSSTSARPRARRRGPAHRPGRRRPPGRNRRGTRASAGCAGRPTCVPVKVSFPAGWLALTSTRAASGRSATSSTACPGRWTATVSGRSGLSTDEPLRPAVLDGPGGHAPVRREAHPVERRDHLRDRHRGRLAAPGHRGRPRHAGAGPPAGGHRRRRPGGRPAAAAAPPAAGSADRPRAATPAGRPTDSAIATSARFSILLCARVISAGDARSAPARRPPRRPADRRGSSGPAGGQ